MINYAILLGRVGKKDSKILKNGSEFTAISIATSKKWKDSSGQAQEEITWHNIKCFSKLAEIAKKYVHVGDLIFVQGNIQNKKIESGDRAGQYIYSIHANELKFIPTGKKNNGESKPSQENSEEDFDFPETDVPF